MRLPTVCPQYKKRQDLLLLLLLSFNGPATEAEPQIIVMRENEIHIRKREERKVDKKIRQRNRSRERVRVKDTEGSEEKERL